MVMGLKSFFYYLQDQGDVANGLILGIIEVIVWLVHCMACGYSGYK